MSQVILLRHGQANSEARDESGYDKLSALGHQQARWLGEHFATSGEIFARVYRGSLRRHAETARSMGFEAAQEDARLDEMAFFQLALLLQQQHGIGFPKEREAFAAHLPVLLEHWRRDEIADAPETFAQFETPVRDALSDIAAGDGRALVVTSGGLIAMAIRHVLGLDVPAMAQLCLSVENSSLHRLQAMPGGLTLVQFNALPHLEHPHRQHARSHL